MKLEELLPLATATHKMYDIGPDGPVEDGIGSKYPAARFELMGRAPVLAEAIINARRALDSYFAEGDPQDLLDARKLLDV